MEVKEAIKLIDKIDDWLINWQDDADSSSLSIDTLYIIDNIPKIKLMLEQGEEDSKELKIVKEELKKVWQMWEELKDRNMCDSRPDGQYLDDEDFEELEQKYLKEASQDEE